MNTIKIAIDGEKPPTFIYGNTGFILERVNIQDDGIGAYKPSGKGSLTDNCKFAVQVVSFLGKPIQLTLDDSNYYRVDNNTNWCAIHNFLDMKK